MKSTRTLHPQQSTLPTTLLSLLSIEDLHWEVQEVQLAVTRRAYELFEARGCEHGHDWEDWFRAESELLRPVPVSMLETEDRISVRANVFGFGESELRVGLEPQRITILGKKEVCTTETEGGKLEYIDWYPDQILQLINLPAYVTHEHAIVELQAGVLKFELPRAVKKIVIAA